MIVPPNSRFPHATMPNPLAVALCLSLPFAFGCGGAEADHPAGTHTHSDGTVHVEGHAEEPVTNDHGAELEEMGALDLGSLAVGGATFALDATGPATAGSIVTLNVRLTDGAMPETVRAWYGLESAVGSLKAKADAHDDHFHADIEIPEPTIEGAALWVETVSTAGQKTRQSLTF